MIMMIYPILYITYCIFVNYINVAKLNLDNYGIYAVKVNGESYYSVYGNYTNINPQCVLLTYKNGDMKYPVETQGH